MQGHPRWSVGRVWSAWGGLASLWGGWGAAGRSRQPRSHQVASDATRVKTLDSSQTDCTTFQNIYQTDQKRLRSPPNSKIDPSSAPRKTVIRRSTHKQVHPPTALPTATEAHRMQHTSARISARTRPNHQRSCTGTQGVASGRIGQALQRTTCTATTQARGPIAAAL